MAPGAKRRRSATVLLLATAAFAGCAESSGSGGREQIASAVGDLGRNLALGKLSKTCEALGSHARYQLGTIGHNTRPTTCERDLDHFLDGMALAADVSQRPRPDLARLTRPRVVSVRFDGDRAVARTVLDGHPLDIPFVEEGGRWKLADLFVATGPVRQDLR